MRTIAVPDVGVRSAGSIRTTPSTPEVLWQPSPAQPRRLNAAGVRQSLPALPTIMSLRMRLITDLSGSMGTFGRGGNDPTGTRHEAALISIEHLADNTKQLDVRVRSFDGNSPLELPWTRYNRRTRRQISNALLAHPTGGSSCLAPSLRDAELDLDAAEVVIVLSDFELYDPDPVATLARLVALAAANVTAIVFTSPPPAALDNTAVTVVRVDPTATTPAEIATAIVRAALAATTIEVTIDRQDQT